MAHKASKMEINIKVLIVWANFTEKGLIHGQMALLTQASSKTE